MDIKFNIKKFPPLYGCDVKGKIKEWNIRVIEYQDYTIIEIVYGYEGGKMTECSKRITSGKNIGKKNETTPYQQAILEATSKWERKKEQGFSIEIPVKPISKQSLKKSPNKKESDIQVLKTQIESLQIKDQKTQIYFPMLACDFQKFKQRVLYPVYIQPKLDGYRMLYNTDLKTCHSRQGKEFEAVKQTSLYKELSIIKDSLVLDGELYKHSGTFEHLGILRKKHLTKQDLINLEEIEYHIYDFIDETKTYKERLDFLQNMFKQYSFTKIKLVDTYLINSQDELKNTHQNFVNNNYEGSIIRTLNGKYRCKARSQDLLKYKDFEDAEFKIVDFTSEQDTSTNQELVVWICETEQKQQFNVRPKGTREERSELFKRGKEFIGQFLNVKYFELTESKIPRFPTTKSESYTSYIRNHII